MEDDSEPMSSSCVLIAAVTTNELAHNGSRSVKRPSRSQRWRHVVRLVFVFIWLAPPQPLRYLAVFLGAFPPSRNQMAFYPA